MPTDSSSATNYEPHGVIPAALLPFHEDFSIDEQSYRSHLRDIASVAGLSAVTVNGHASEVASCSFDEQRRVLEIALEEIGGDLPIVNGVYAESGIEAARIAKMSANAGASALLVFPPGGFALGQSSDMALAHFRAVGDACDLPIILFQYPLAGGQGYPMETLSRLLDEVPTIRAIKDWTSDPRLHERQIRALQSRGRPVAVLSTHSAWLLSSLVLGCQGLLSGSGSVIAGLHVELFQAVQANDLEAARVINDRIWPTVEAFYAHPMIDMHNRMKEALVILGRLPRAVVRPPLVKLKPDEIERIRGALVAAGLAG